MKMNVIAHVYNDFTTKFGIPRQSRLVDTPSRVVLQPPYNLPDAVRGLEEFTHIWLIWEFSGNVREDGKWSATVRPPRLGGNVRKGVFATRSPFRPNPIGLSCVKLEKITYEESGPVLHILGADLMNGTPIYDIKPYVTYSDSIPEAYGGFSEKVKDYRLEVVIPEEHLVKIPDHQRQLLEEILGQDPRPSYQEDPHRVYGMEYGGMEIKFTVSDGVLTVADIQNI